MASTMIERIARKFCEMSARDPDEAWVNEGFVAVDSRLGWRAFVADASDLLIAMREPSPEMVAACEQLPGLLSDYWKRSIDAALDGPIAEPARVVSDHEHIDFSPSRYAARA